MPKKAKKNGLNADFDLSEITEGLDFLENKPKRNEFEPVVDVPVLQHHDTEEIGRAHV